MSNFKKSVTVDFENEKDFNAFNTILSKYTKENGCTKSSMFSEVLEELFRLEGLEK